MAYKFKKLKIPEVVLISSDQYPDERGYFQELFKASEFEKAGLPINFCQDNFSFSKKNVLRGLHFQLPPKAQGKLIRVLEGKIWDVAVDLRQSFPTFKQWVAKELSEESSTALFIPPGFAHGFVVLSETCRVAYKTTTEYDPNLETGIIWNDPVLAIAWPVVSPIVSAKDSQLPKINLAKFFS